MEPQPQESPVQDSPVQAQAPQVQPAQEQAGSGSQPALKPAATAKTRAARRHRKAILLPQITQLALEGQTGRAIALRFNLPTRTVNHWLREMRSEWLAAATHSGADLMAVGLARLDGIYCEAMEAWQDADRNSAAGEGEEPSHHRRPAGDQERPPPQAAWRCAARPGDQRGAGITQMPGGLGTRSGRRAAPVGAAAPLDRGPGTHEQRRAHRAGGRVEGRARTCRQRPELSE